MGQKAIFGSLTQPGNVVTPAASSVVGTTYSADQFRQIGGSAAHIVISILTLAATATLTFTLQGKDLFGNYYNIISTTALAAISSTTPTVLKFGLGITAVANGAANDAIPDVYRVAVTQAVAAGACTFTVAQNDIDV
jgi:hypothetical protein